MVLCESYTCTKGYCNEGFIDGMCVLQREREREPASISRPEREKWIIFKSPISVRPEPVALTTDAG